ncbi:MAG: NAD-dependent deacylase [Labilithrix sp.]|nr:NAD-dependent deacylase [Labilithrix sp.]MCW5817866.1 NAD-dependent deacylase [Labilithrix sp.]
MTTTSIRFRDFRRIVFFTGAGMSAESGIPTYRGSGGIWKEYNYEDYACQRAFERDPEKVWDFHDKRREMVRSKEPNRGHLIVAEVQERQPGTKIVTQNIDGMHQRAGAEVEAELHGSLWRVRCDPQNIVRDDDSVPMSPRKCECGGYWRPDIVWFEDQLDHRVVRRAREALEECDLLVSIGTSAVVYPAAQLPRIAAERGAVTVEVNLEDTAMSELYQHRLRGKASDVLAQLDAR